jgi:hypothetical protein
VLGNEKLTVGGLILALTGLILAVVCMRLRTTWGRA